MVVRKEMKITTPIEVSEMETDTIQAPSGEDLIIAGRTGKDIILTLTDAAGARSITVKDSAGATVCVIDSNGLITTAAGVAGPVTGAVTGNVTGNLTGDVTKGSTDLAITAAANKDVIVKLGDADGAKKLIIKDSENAVLGSIDSDGLLTVIKVKGNLPIATAAAAPTEAGMIEAFGDIAANAGLKATYIDSTAETGSTYDITCDGVAYYATDLASDVLRSDVSS